MPSWTALYVTIYWWVLLPCSFAASWWWGDRVLRSAFTWYAGLVTAGDLVLHRSMYRQFEPLQATTDITLWAALTWLAIRHRRWWLIAAAALQLVACLGHLGSLVASPSRLAYAMMTSAGGYPILILLIIPLTAAIRSRGTTSRHPVSRSRVDTRPP